MATNERDLFAGLAMQSLINDNEIDWRAMCVVLREDHTITPTAQLWNEMFYRYVAHRAYRHADAMLAERDKT